MYIIKKSIFVLKNYGLKAFIKKAIRFPINRLNLLRQIRAEEKARKNSEKDTNFLNQFYFDDVFINQRIVMICNLN
jgi:hypothetical protein